mgnify:CR=1|jgi:hypothetical protein|tara:strand:- start:3687 stop:3914 length:228 start_codon:yes stop_codon:yes gene_type:complete
METCSLALRAQRENQSAEHGDQSQSMRKEIAVRSKANPTTPSSHTVTSASLLHLNRLEDWHFDHTNNRAKDLAAF